SKIMMKIRGKIQMPASYSYSYSQSYSLMRSLPRALKEILIARGVRTTAYWIIPYVAKTDTRPRMAVGHLCDCRAQKTRFPEQKPGCELSCDFGLIAAHKKPGFLIGNRVCELTPLLIDPFVSSGFPLRPAGRQERAAVRSPTGRRERWPPG